MKIFKISVVALLLSATFMACKKDNDPGIVALDPDKTTNVGNVPGIWAGQYTTTTRTSPVYLSFRIKPDWSLDLLNESHDIIGSGTWTMTGSEFKAVYTVDSTHKSSAVIGIISTSSSPVQISGKWQYDQSYEDSGFWYMDKVY